MPVCLEEVLVGSDLDEREHGASGFDPDRTAPVRRVDSVRPREREVGVRRRVDGDDERPRVAFGGAASRQREHGVRRVHRDGVYW